MAAQMVFTLNPNGLGAASNGDVTTLVAPGGLSTIAEEMKVNDKMDDTIARMVAAGRDLTTAVGVQVLRLTAKALLAMFGQVVLNGADVVGVSAALEADKQPTQAALDEAVTKVRPIAAHVGTFLAFVGVQLAKSGHHMQGTAAEQLAARMVASLGIKQAVAEVFGAGKAGLYVMLHGTLHVFDMGMMQRLVASPPAKLLKVVHGIIKQRLPALPAAVLPLTNAVAAHAALSQSAKYSKLAEVLKPVADALEAAVARAKADPDKYDANNPANADRIKELGGYELRIVFLVAVAAAAKVAAPTMVEAKSYVRMANAMPAVVENANHLVASVVLDVGAERTAAVKGILVGVGALKANANVPEFFVPDETPDEVAAKEAAERKKEIDELRHQKKLEAIQRGSE